EHRVSPPPPQRLFMNPAQIRQLAAEDVSFGSHTRRHPILSKLRIEDQRHEIETSRDEVEKLVGVRPSHFAYPNGSLLDFDGTTISILRASGFTFGYTTVQRYLSPSNDAFALPRIGIGSDNLTRLAIKQLAPWVSPKHIVERAIRARVRSYSLSARKG